MNTITQIRVADMSFDDTVYQSTGSKLLDSLNQCHSLDETSIVFGADHACGLGLHHMEIPVLGSDAETDTWIDARTDARIDAIATKKQAEDTARQQAVSRLSSIVKQDRSSMRSSVRS